MDIAFIPDFPYNRYHPLLINTQGFYFTGRAHERKACENLVWFHRYCYYVIGQSLIADAEYDKLERRLKALYRGRTLPPASPLRVVGSSLKTSYPAGILAFFESGF